MTTAPSNQPGVMSSQSGDEEIDLLQVVGALSRHRRLIAKVAGASLLLITGPGVATRTQLNQLGQALALQGTPLAGWVFLDPDLRV